jgi:hypothetical protein
MIAICPEWHFEPSKALLSPWRSLQRSASNRAVEANSQRASHLHTACCFRRRPITRCCLAEVSRPMITDNIDLMREVADSSRRVQRNEVPESVSRQYIRALLNALLELWRYVTVCSVGRTVGVFICATLDSFMHCINKHLSVRWPVGGMDKCSGVWKRHRRSFTVEHAHTMAPGVVLGLSAPSRGLHEPRNGITTSPHGFVRVIELCALEESGCMRGRSASSHTSQTCSTTKHLESFDRWLDGLIASPATLFDATGGQATASSLCCACPPRFCSCNIRVARLILAANVARHAIPVLTTHRLTCMLGLRIQPATNDP